MNYTEWDALNARVIRTHTLVICILAYAASMRYEMYKIISHIKSYRVCVLYVANAPNSEQNMVYSI